MPEKEPTVKLDSWEQGEFRYSWRFGGYLETLQAMELVEIQPLLTKIEKYTAQGLHAVGFIAFEAAAGLNTDLSSGRAVEGLPLAWFAVFRDRFEAPAATAPAAGSVATPSLEADIDSGSYHLNVQRIRDYIANGDSYQVNYTFRIEGDFRDDPLELYLKTARGQSAPFGAYIDTGRFVVISASPELFFSLKDGLIRTRPMKGTAARGRWPKEDEDRISALKGSAKERAENLMIVDLLRNDLGIIAQTGSVQVESLFDVETYPTLHQMTSTVSARIREGTGLGDILGALFPCGSVTGAPKKRSMEIINELEAGPRGVYCGAIGYVSPGGEALFSVAIRTLLFERETHKLRLGIGSGITTDSDAPEEYRECLTKAAFISPGPDGFQLIEALRLENGEYPLLERHLERLAKSARFFGFFLREDEIRAALKRHAEGIQGIHKVRLLLEKSGECALSSEPLLPADGFLRVAISDQRIDSKDIFRYHKTTCRDQLDTARARRPDCHEVVFLNERGELTEGSYHNLLLKIDGELRTPKLESGLLPGVMRQELLERGEAVESDLFPADLARAEEIWLINSVRGMRRAVFVDEGRKYKPEKTIETQRRKDADKNC